MASILRYLLKVITPISNTITLQLAIYILLQALLEDATERHISSAVFEGLPEKRIFSFRLQMNGMELLVLNFIAILSSNNAFDRPILET